MLVFVGALAAFFAGACATKCTTSFNNATLIETVCYSVVTSFDALQIRSYNIEPASLVSYYISPAVTTYQEADNIAAYCVLGYFVGYTNAKNQSILQARTAPLFLRPPQAHVQSHNFWLGGMFVAPSRFPSPKLLPAPTYNVSLSEAPADGSIQLASLHVQFTESPQPADFDATCAQLLQRLKTHKIQVDLASVFTTTHAYYFSREHLGPWDFECWVGVVF